MDDIRSRLETALEGGHSIERELGGGGMSRVFLAHEQPYPSEESDDDED